MPQEASTASSYPGGFRGAGMGFKTAGGAAWQRRIWTGAPGTETDDDSHLTTLYFTQLIIYSS